MDTLKRVILVSELGRNIFIGEGQAFGSAAKL